jgi:predicted AAA+ superfamily ATPase
VQAEGLTRNVSAFARFLEAVSFSHGAPLNLAGVSRDCQVERKTVEAYVTILEDLLLSWRLPVFTRRAKRALAVHPKFYLFDAGVFRSLRPTGPLDSPHEIDGAALEGLIAQHLRAWIAYGNRACELSYWRTRSGSEVDFVLYGPDQFWAIEVKNSPEVRPADLRALSTFGKDYPESQRLLLYRGPQRFVRKGIHCMPCDEFLRALRPHGPIAGL